GWRRQRGGSWFVLTSAARLCGRKGADSYTQLSNPKITSEPTPTFCSMNTRKLLLPSKRHCKEKRTK
ncbi:MAG: hypothetical protein LBL39_00925, partial [Planctomycetaceae bacterium]|nr:hypothetical protein [Planctomycetaceae bacterium]